MPEPIAMQIKRAEKLVRSRAEAAQAALMLELTKRVVQRTPVDTGRARGNWMAGIGTPDRSTTTSTDSAGAATIRAAGGQFKRGPLGVPLFLTNSLPYIRRLEYDRWSKQAPGGMVRLAMAELRQTAREVAAIVRGTRG